MTYYALKYADKILIPIRRTTDIAFCMLNIKRLIQAFNFPIDKFVLLTKNKKIDTFHEITLLIDEEGRVIGRLDMCEEDTRIIIDQVLKKATEEMSLENKKKRWLYFIGKIFAKDGKGDTDTIISDNEKKLRIKL